MWVEESTRVSRKLSSFSMVMTLSDSVTLNTLGSSAANRAEFWVLVPNIDEVEWFGSEGMKSAELTWVRRCFQLSCQLVGTSKLLSGDT